MIDSFGLEESLKMLKGMFAFAVWDKKCKELYLARDIAGEKPLYYGFQNNTFIFGSELKALRLHSGFDHTIDHLAINMFMKYSYIPEPLSIYKKTKKLPAGSYIKLKYDNLINNEKIRVNKFWTINENINCDKEKYLHLSNKDIINIFEKKLLASVSLQQLSDRPIGAFLSGGVDSSLIVSLMQSLNTKKIKTFTIANQNQKYDESNRAREISDFLGTDHHEFKIQERDMLNIVPELQRIYDEPFADSSQIPSLLVNSLAKDFVKVCLSGDGGDELFGGYNRYVWSQRFQKIPSFTKNFISIFFNYFDPINLAFFYEKIENILPNRYKFNLPEEKFRKVQLAINSVNSIELYDKLTSTSQENNLLINNISFDNISAKWNELKNITNDITAMMALDFQTYLSDDILCKNDRASMYHSLEMRAPFLDKDIIKFAFNISDKFKINNGETKWISRQVLKKYLPVDKLSKTKTGFSIPIGSWLNNELKDWSEDLLDKKKIDKFEIFDSKKIINLWNDHKTGKANDNNQIWNIVMLQSWLEKNV